MEDTRRIWPNKPTNQGSYGLTEIKKQTRGMHAWDCKRSSVYIVVDVSWVFCVTPTVGVGMFLTLACSLNSFSSYCVALSGFDMRAFRLSSCLLVFLVFSSFLET